MSSSNAIRRDVGPFALMLTGLGSIIGSGWLFGAWKAAGLAGPGAVWAWVLGAAIIMTIALTYAELGAMFPESGGMVRYGHYSHGSLVGFIAAWANWIAIVSVIPVEAEASVQYMASWPWTWAQDLYHVTDGVGELSHTGLGIAAVLVIIYFLLNFWSVKLFAHSNTAITVFKLVVPAATGLALIASGFHPENFSVGIHGGDHAIDFPAVLTAVATAGIVFSFNGFQSPVNLAGEARNPGRSIPFAVVGSILLATVIYVILQVAYLGSVPRDLLAQAGWHGINFRSPFAELAGDAALRGCLHQPERYGHDLHRHHRAHDLRDGAQRYAAENPRPRASEVGRAAPGDVAQPGGVVSVPVLLPRLGHAGGGDLGGDDHFLSHRPGERDDAAPYRHGTASPLARGGAARAGRRRLHHGDGTAVLGEVATDRRNHFADGGGAAGVSVLPGKIRLA
jgi:hypothetical protein